MGGGRLGVRMRASVHMDQQLFKSGSRTREGVEAWLARIVLVEAIMWKSGEVNKGKSAFFGGIRGLNICIWPPARPC